MTATTNAPTPSPVTVLRLLRLESGVSLRELAEATGINRGRLSTIERGLAPTAAEAQAIADVLAAAFRTGPR